MKRSAVFLDRDGTVIEDTGYLADPDQVRLIPGSSGAIRRLRDTGSLILIVSNQSGVARGLFDEADLARVHERMETLLHADGAQLDDAYYCPYLDGPDAAVAAYRRHSDLRKPHPGMLLAAARDHDLDLTASWMIGDAPSDVEAGARAGCRTILIDPDGTYEHNGRGTKPTHVVRTLEQAADVITTASNMHTKKPRRRTKPDTTTNPGTTRPAPPAAKPTDPTPRPAGDKHPTTNIDPAPTNAHNPDDPTRPHEQHQPPPSAEPSAHRADDIVRLLTRIDDRMDRAQRNERQHDFSVLRLFGSLLQMFAIVAAVWGILALAADRAGVATARLTLACFLQLASVTAFAIDRFR